MCSYPSFKRAGQINRIPWLSLLSRDLPKVGVSSTETDILGRKWSACRHQCLLLSVLGWSILVPGLGDTLGGALLTGSTQSVGGELPACVCANSSVLPRLIPAGEPAAGVSHDVTDSDTSWMSHSDTASKLHNVTPGTPGMPPSWF